MRKREKRKGWEGEGYGSVEEVGWKSVVER